MDYMILIAVAVFVKAVNGQLPNAFDPCRTDRDRLLMPDVSSQGSHFLNCQASGSGIGNMGYWMRQSCPFGDDFEFIYEKQRCIRINTRHSAKALHLHKTIEKLVATAIQMTPIHAGAHESCAKGVSCGFNSYCDLSVFICKCPRGTHSVDGICVKALRVARPGEECVENWQCTGRSSCQRQSQTSRSICTCSQNTILVGKICANGQLSRPGSIQRHYVGDRCSQDKRCIFGSVCSTISSRCICPIGTVNVGKSCDRVGIVDSSTHRIKVFSPPARKPLSQRLTSDNTITSPKASLKSGMWRDPGTDKRLMLHDAKSSPPVGSRCASNTDCGGGAYCRPERQKVSTCECLSTHTEVNSICYKIIYPGESGCQNDQQCTAAFGGAHCSGQGCICPRGLSAESNTCRPGSRALISLPGGSCSAGQQCTGGSTCDRFGWCACPRTDMTVHNGNCIQNKPKLFIAMPGDRCDAQTKCTVASFCEENVCRCRPGDHIVNGACVLRVRIQSPPGGDCGDSQLCIGGSKCNGERCKCPDGLIPHMAKCLDVRAHPQDSCARGERCMGDSVCRNRICTCPRDTIVVKNRCITRPVSRVLPGDSCDRFAKCSGRSRCVDGTCKCPRGMMKNGEGYCDVITLAIRTRCIDKAYCDSGVCRCPRGTGADSSFTRCVPLLTLDSIVPQENGIANGNQPTDDDPQAHNTQWERYENTHKDTLSTHKIATRPRPTVSVIPRNRSYLLHIRTSTTMPDNEYLPIEKTTRPQDHTDLISRNGARRSSFCPSGVEPVSQEPCSAATPNCPMASFCYATASAARADYFCCPTYHPAYFRNRRRLANSNNDILR